MPKATRAAILFPGQGADLTGARETVEEHCPELHDHACQILGEDVFEHAAASTRYAQPATYLASLAGWRAALDAGVQPYALAGHSLGELAALAAAGVLRPREALELVVLRGRLMDELTATAEGGMVAILKGSVEQAERLTLAHGLSVANYNAPGQTVLSGPLTGIEGAALDARAQGMRALALNVSGAFHTAVLGPARVEFRRALSAVTLEPPAVTVFSSMTAAPFTDPVNELATALIRPVRWSETMIALDRAGASAYLDVGPGRVLAGLVTRNLGDARVIGLEVAGAHA